MSDAEVMVELREALDEIAENPELQQAFQAVEVSYVVLTMEY